MEKVAQSGSARPTQSGLPARSQTWGRGPDWVTRRFALGGQWAWAWQTAEEHEFPSTEPNQEMRQAAERLLAGYPQFVSLAARAESIPLDDASVDFVTAGGV